MSLTPDASNPRSIIRAGSGGKPKASLIFNTIAFRALLSTKLSNVASQLALAFSLSIGWVLGDDPCCWLECSHRKVVERGAVCVP
jgi:hypothetical protein